MRQVATSHRIVRVYVEEKLWRVECEGHQPRAARSAEEALALARWLATDVDSSEVRLHLPGGSVESEFFGNPPFDPHPDDVRSPEGLEAQRHRRRDTGAEPHER